MTTETSNQKVVLITGGAARIGAGIVKYLHKTGFTIALHYSHSKTAAKTLCSELNTIRANSAACFEADLLKIDEIEQLVKDTLAQWGKLDVLINNASSFYPTPLNNIDEEQWRDLTGTNALAPAYLCKHCSPALQLSKGCIINISDIVASTGRKNFLFYSMAKAALNNLTRTLARELAPEIRVNAIAPGVILPPNISKSHSNKIPIENETEPLSISCLNYPGKTEDIAFAVAFLIESSYISGQTLSVDGGRKLLV